MACITCSGTTAFRKAVTNVRRAVWNSVEGAPGQGDDVPAPLATLCHQHPLLEGAFESGGTSGLFFAVVGLRLLDAMNRLFIPRTTG